jgi:hypothetical protein
VSRHSSTAAQPGADARVAFEQPDHDPVSDPRVRPLLEQYVRLAGGRLAQVEPQLFELQVPASDRAFFAGRERVLLAFSVDALERSPDAEMAVVGSAFVQQLLDAIRSRGSRRALGLVPPTFSADPQAAPLDVAVVNGSAGAPVVGLARHPVGRLLARVLIRAGATVEEHLIEGGIYDLATGAPVAADLAACCAALEESRVPPAGPEAAQDVGQPERRPLKELLDLMTSDLRARSISKIERLQAEANRALAGELARIDAYYKAVLAEDAGAGSSVPDVAARRAINAEYARRRAEEERRHQVRCVVHPLQLIESELLVQRAEWTLSTPRGRQGTVAARRALSGKGDWQLSCPTCASTPSALLVCREGHVACAVCGRNCSVCGEEFCKDHGLAECHVDRAPACGEHARTCSSCRRSHCSAHEGRCAEGDHAACVACLAGCALCGRVVCASHASQSTPSSPRGVRRFCTQCVVYCEGGKNEPVGIDEVVRCASCERSVCEAHQAKCAVDGNVHCSTHLRRTDRSRRLVCESDRAICTQEPEAVLARDEVVECITCGGNACTLHASVCVEDGGHHCMRHLAPLKDRPGAMACPTHRTICHIDSVAFSLDGTLACPVCTRPTCSGHRRACASCGRSVCTAELDRPTGSCATCLHLAATPDPADDIIQAAMEANGGEPPNAKAWRTSRDATHTVVEVSHGWMRRTVFTVRHGDERAETVVRHSAFGARRRR